MNYTRIFQRKDKELVQYKVLQSVPSNYLNKNKSTVDEKILGYVSFWHENPRLWIDQNNCDLSQDPDNVYNSNWSYNFNCSEIGFRDKTLFIFNALMSTTYNDRTTFIGFRQFDSANRNMNSYNDLKITYDSTDNTFKSHVFSPTSYNVNDTQIVNTQWSNYRHPIMQADSNLMLHVGGSNASDTADLFTKRGYSAEYPFATLNNCLKFVLRYYQSRIYYISILLHSDQVFNYGNLDLTGLYALQINSADTTRRIITFKRSMTVLGGQLILGKYLTLKNDASYTTSYLVNGQSNSSVARIKIYSDIETTDTFNNGCISGCDGASYELQEGMSISGTMRFFMCLHRKAHCLLYTPTKGTFNFNVNMITPTSLTASSNNALFYLYNNGKLFLGNTGIFTGTNTGKGYVLLTGSQLYLNGDNFNNIPHTLDNYCDSTSVVM